MMEVAKNWIRCCWPWTSRDDGYEGIDGSYFVALKDFSGEDEEEELVLRSLTEVQAELAKKHRSLHPSKINFDFDSYKEDEDDVIPRLLSTLDTGSIQKLRLRATGAKPQALSTFISSTSWSSLATFEWAWGPLTLSVCRAIAESCCNLRSLSIRFGLEPLEHITHCLTALSPLGNHLQEFALLGCGILTKDIPELILRFLHSQSQLTRLSLAGCEEQQNRILDSGLKLLLQAPRLPYITHLNLEACGLTSDAISILSANKSRLKRLNTLLILRDNHFDNAARFRLQRAFGSHLAIA